MIDKATEANILRLYYAEKWRIGTIATQLHVHHTTVQRVLAQAGLEPQRVSQRPSMSDPYTPFIVETLEKYPSLCASRLFQMVRERGYPGGPDHFRRVVARFRPRPKHEAFLRLRTLIGEQAQADWGAFGKLAVGRALRSLWAFVMVLSWSRQIFLRFYLSAAMPSFVRGHADAFAFFRGVPRVILYDNLKSAVLERAAHAIHFNPRILELARHYKFEPRPVAQARGNEKGRVERAIRYVRTSFFPARKYTDLDDLNRQAFDWMTGVAADRRAHEDPSQRVRDAFSLEQSKLLPLPDEPFPSDEIVGVESGKTPYVRFDLNDYSVPHTHVRRSLTVAASLDTVRVLDGTHVLATHSRCWDRAQQIEDPSHIQQLVSQKRRARAHRALDRLSSAVPSAQALLGQAAERGGNLGNITGRLLVLLEQVGPSELEHAVACAVERNLPTVGAVRQLLDQRFADRGLPPPISARLSNNERANRVTVRNHLLATYDNLRKTDNDQEDS
ncbi:MAG TPA: IS21 family transposase [Polyangiaceae bacterium]|nr:IS21 family transposase [Polyangiaceae bacterium]